MSIQFPPLGPTIHTSLEVWFVIQPNVRRDTISDQVMLLVLLCKYGWLVPKTDCSWFISGHVTTPRNWKREPRLNQFIVSCPTRKLCLICFRGAASEHQILFQTRKNSYRKWTIFLNIFMNRKLYFIRMSLNSVKDSGTDMRTLK